MRTAAVLLACLSMTAVMGCSSSTGPDGPDMTADVSVSPASGTVLTDFVFTATAGSRADRALEYRWDWESDGIWDTEWSAESIATHRFSSGDTVTITVEAGDGSTTDQASADVVVDSRHGFILDRITLPSWVLAKGLAWDGSKMWVTSWDRNMLAIDVATGDSLASIPGPSHWTGGIAWDGEYLWTADWIGGPRLNKQDPTDGAVLDGFSVVYTGQVGGLDWTGEVFYYGSDEHGGQGDGLVHIYSADGTHLSSFACPLGSTSPRGLAYDGEDLWLTIEESDSLYVVDADDGTVLRVMPYPDECTQPTEEGIQVVGDHLWAIVSNAPSELVRIVP